MAVAEAVRFYDGATAVVFNKSLSLVLTAVRGRGSEGGARLTRRDFLFVCCCLLPDPEGDVSIWLWPHGNVHQVVAPFWTGLVGSTFLSRSPVLHHLS